MTKSNTQTATAGLKASSHHHLFIGDSRRMANVRDGEVHLVITSPPYPMIEMWDETFRNMSPEVGTALDKEDGFAAFDAMHVELDKVWMECSRILSPGGFACINIGDATRTMAGEFCLYPNQARIVTGMRLAGFTPLPDILWRKPTNAPNKFMGSGMLPAGAYVTYEHEYILVFRKGGKRCFRSEEEKARRSRSAFFWEERNCWFSDVWMDLRGAGQRMERNAGRERSGAFPFELPYRIINMYSAYGDVVLDPFVGTGTTMLAAAASARNSIGFETVEAFGEVVATTMRDVVTVGNARLDERFTAHHNFLKVRNAAGNVPDNNNKPHGFPVVTRQESEMVLLRPQRLTIAEAGRWVVEHGQDAPQQVVLPSPEKRASRGEQLSLLG